MLKTKALFLKGVGPLYLFPLSLLLSNIFISNTLNRRRVCMYYLLKYKRLRERGASGRLTGSYARSLTLINYIDICN